MNNRKWTNDVFKENEKIECNEFQMYDLFCLINDCVIMIHIKLIVNGFGLRQIFFIEQSHTYDYDL